MGSYCRWPWQAPVSDFVASAPGDESPPFPSLVHLLVLRVPARADADPLPRVVLDKVVKAPQAGCELLHRLAPHVGVRQDGLGQR